MKRKMANIMTTMLLISNISINSVYASPINLNPVPAPDPIPSITTETENNNSENSEETSEHDTLGMPDSNDGFHDGSEDINYDGNEDYSFLEDVGGVEETSSYINLGILRLDSFLVKNMDGDYVLNNHYAKIDEIIDYAKKKTKNKYFNSNSDENISNSLNKTLRGIEYDEEKKYILYGFRKE